MRPRKKTASDFTYVRAAIFMCLALDFASLAFRR